jgi:hypothetical protein
MVNKRHAVLIKGGKERSRTEPAGMNGAILQNLELTCQEKNSKECEEEILNIIRQP